MTHEVLAPEEAARLADFARACKAAARAVLLYPDGHPAIAATLGRIAHITSVENLPGPLVLAVLPDSMLLENRMLPKPEPAVSELAVLLTSHLIGRMVVNPGGDRDAWRSFLLLLGRAPESVRAEGGIARVWTTMAGRHVEIKEVDYAGVLKERSGGDSASWDVLISRCLQGDTYDLDDDAVRDLMSAAGNADTLIDLMSALEQSADGQEGGLAIKTAALLRLLKTIVETASSRNPEGVEPILRNCASAVGRLTPDVLMGLLSHRDEVDAGDLMNAVVSRMNDGMISRFVARNVINASPTDRLAQAFQTLVREDDERQRLLALAKEDVAASPLGSTEGFESVWDHVAQQLLTSYSDKPYVSEDYGRELSVSRTIALQVEQVNDDPPERIGAWLSTVATSALRSLDLTLVLDLLRIEGRDASWGELMPPVVSLLEDLLLVGDFDAAEQVLSMLVAEVNQGSTAARRQHAVAALDLLVAGPMMRHIATHLATIDQEQFERVKTMCVSMGVMVVKPLAETLAVEERPRTRDRLTSILMAFGAAARKTIERLKTSPNAAVRRTAILLMREFGGTEALPDLRELLDDSEPQVQREAVRAILNLGTDGAYRVLQQALTTGTDRSRDTILQVVGSLRDERAAPLFVHILKNLDRRGPLADVYLRAIESLGALRDPEGVQPLKDVLYQGEWWAPRRTRRFRSAAAAALARLGTSDAIAVLEEATASGPRGVRAAARPPLNEARRRQSREERVR